MSETRNTWRPVERRSFSDRDWCFLQDIYICSYPNAVATSDCNHAGQVNSIRLGKGRLQTHISTNCCCISVTICILQQTAVRSHKNVNSKGYNARLTLNIPSLARQRCLPSWGPRRTPWFFFFVISQLFDAVDYSNYVFWVSETIIQWFKHC